MRLVIFTGLLYIAYAINSEFMKSCENNFYDLFLIGLAFWLALIGDVKELFKSNKQRP